MAVTRKSLELPERYKKLNKFPGGGMGDVIVCSDQHLERNVVIKYLQRGVDKQRLIDEIHALQRIRSKHVVQIFDIIVSSKGIISIVEEFIDGADLSEIDLPLSFDDFLEILWQLSSGISDIHECGVIHRDIKPNNIKIDSERIAKIFDFGLARPFGTKASTRGFKGTIGFAAPELYRAGIVNFSSATDVYAFGVLAIFLANGEVPEEFLGLPPQNIRDVSFEYFIPNLPTDLAELLESCWSYDPDCRPEISTVRDVIARYILYDKHRALLILNGESYVIDNNTRVAEIDVQGLAFLNITYDGLDFIAKNVSGTVNVNNTLITNGFVFPGSCVIEIGGGSSRLFATFDISCPEVVL